MTKTPKTETPEMLRKRKEKEVKQLRMLEKERAKPKGNGYLFYMIALIAVAYMVDEITSNINTMMQSEIAIALFGDRLSIMSLASMLTLPLLAFAIVYRTLADKIGRKPILCMNLLGMAFALFFILLAGKLAGIGGIVLYMIAVSVANFFIPNDTQVLYLMESVPEGKRATYVAITKACGNLAIMVIPLMRSIFMGSDITKWYLVYLVPAVIAIAASVLCFMTLRETDVFIEQRIAWLNLPDEARKSQTNNKKKDDSHAQGGLGAAFRFSFRDKQLKWIFICVMLYGIGACGFSYYSKIMDVYYTTEEVTTGLMVYPISFALGTFLGGLLSDKFGRKATVVTFGSASLLSFIVFVISCIAGASPVIPGLAVGLYMGTFYAAGETLSCMMAGESAPTNLRASIMSACSIMNMAGKMLSSMIPTILLLVTGDNYDYLPWICAFGAIPTMALTLFFVIKNIRDTTNADLTSGSV